MSQSDDTSTFGVIWLILIVVSLFLLVRDIVSVNVHITGKVETISGSIANNGIEGVVFRDGHEVYRAPARIWQLGEYALDIPNDFGYPMLFLQEPTATWGIAHTNETASLDNPTENVVQLLFFLRGQEPACSLQLDSSNNYTCLPSAAKKLSRSFSVSLDTLVALTMTMFVPIIGACMTKKLFTRIPENSNTPNSSTSLPAAVIVVVILFVAVFALLALIGSILSTTNFLITGFIGIVLVMILIVAIFGFLNPTLLTRVIEFFEAVLRSLPGIGAVLNRLSPPTNQETSDK